MCQTGRETWVWSSGTILGYFVAKSKDPTHAIVTSNIYSFPDLPGLRRLGTAARFWDCNHHRADIRLLAHDAGLGSTDGRHAFPGHVTQLNRLSLVSHFGTGYQGGVLARGLGP